MAITYFGRAISPADNADGGATPTSISVTPPSSMSAGQLVVLIGNARAAGNTNPMRLGEQSGQKWFEHDTANQASNTHLRLVWCRFNGTWGADPSMVITTGAPMQLLMLVYNADNVDLDWALDVERSGAAHASPSSPFDITQPGVTTTVDGALVLAAWGSVDDNTWALQTGGWSQPGGEAYWRNLGGSDQSLSVAYQIKATAGATGDVTNRQATLGGDNTASLIVAFRNDLKFARRAPTSDESASGTWSGSSGTRYQAVDDHQDWARTDLLTHGTTAGNITFGFAGFSIPAGSTIRRVMLRWIDQKTGSGAANIQGRIKVGGNYYQQGSYNPVNGNLENRLEIFTVNPKTTVAWTLDDLNGVGSNALEAFGVLSSDANPTIELTSIEMEVEYAPPVAAPLSGSVTLALTPAATMTVVRVLVGSVALTLTPAASLSQEQSIVGAVTLSLTPAATMVVDRTLVGSVTLAFTPAAEAALSPVLAGAVTITLTPAAALVVDRALAGAVTLSLTPAAGFTIERVLVGSVTATLTPAASLAVERVLAGTTTLTFTPAATLEFVDTSSISGSVTLAFTPTATLAVERVLIGSTTIAFTPTAGLTVERVLVGSGTITLTPAASLVLTDERVLAGSVTLALTPAATMTVDRVLGGTITFELVPAAGLHVERVLEGTITFTLTPAATFGTAVIDGTITLTLTPFATLAVVPLPTPTPHSWGYPVRAHGSRRNRAVEVG